MSARRFAEALGFGPKDPIDRNIAKEIAQVGEAKRNIDEAFARITEVLEKIETEIAEARQAMARLVFDARRLVDGGHERAAESRLIRAEGMREQLASMDASRRSLLAERNTLANDVASLSLVRSRLERDRASYRASKMAEDARSTAHRYAYDGGASLLEDSRRMLDAYLSERRIVDELSQLEAPEGEALRARALLELGRLKRARDGGSPLGSGRRIDDPAPDRG